MVTANPADEFGHYFMGRPPASHLYPKQAAGESEPEALPYRRV